MSDTTARFALPYIAPGQAQKEVAHNEALARIDAVLQASVLAMGTNDPPASPPIGGCWIVGTAPTGGWAGQGNALAIWTDGGWRFIVPTPGMVAWQVADGVPARFDGTAWRSGVVTATGIEIGGVQVVGPRQPAIAAPSGGTVIDAEARKAISVILLTLSAHGLIAA